MTGGGGNEEFEYLEGDTERSMMGRMGLDSIEIGRV
jgi:hypothetical protein